MSGRSDRDFEGWKKYVGREAPGLLDKIDPATARDIFDHAYAAGEQNMENIVAREARDREAYGG